MTIYILSFNHARFLPAAIESALAQTYKNIEIIIADDGSTDESLAIAQGYAARHSDIIKVITHPGNSNRGISATVNLCFERANGSYVQGLASDDLLHPHKLAEQVGFLESHPELGWVYGYAVRVDERNRRRAAGLFGRDITRMANPLEQLILGNVICGLTPLIRRTVLRQMEPHDETLVFGDWEFWLRLTARQKPGFLPRTRARYRVHGHNTSIGVADEILLGHSLEVMRKLRWKAERVGGSLASPRAQALLDLQCAFFSYALNETERGRQYLAGAFETDPELDQDPRHFCWWLGHCQRTLRMWTTHLPNTDFAAWVVAHVPGELDEAFVRAVARHVRGSRFGAVGDWYHHFQSLWKIRRTLIQPLLRDPRVWRERELFALHIEALLGSRVRRGLGRLLRSNAAR